MAFISNKSGIPDYSVAVAPSDTQDIPNAGRCVGLWVGSGGDLSVVYDGGEEDVLHGVQGGVPLSGRFRRVNDTNTTASQISALMVRA